MLIFLKNILQLILSSKHAWRDIAADKTPLETVSSRGLYPLMAVMLLTIFIRPIYGLLKFDLVLLLQTALIQFVAIFAALYIGKTVLANLLPKYNISGAEDIEAADTVTVYTVGIITIIQIFENLLPVELTITQFLPVLAIIPLWKSAEYLEIEHEHETMVMAAASASIILPIIVLNFAMSYLIG